MPVLSAMIPKRLVVVALLLLASVPLSAQAVRQGETVVLASGTVVGPGWFWVYIQPGSRAPLSIELAAYDVGPPAAGGRFARTIHGIGTVFHQEGVSVRSGIWSSDLNAVQLLNSRFPVMNLGGIEYSVFDREHRELVWTAGDVSSWSFEIRGAPDVKIVELATGNSTFLLTSEDFDTSLAVEAHAHALGLRYQGPSSKEWVFTGRWAGGFNEISLLKSLSGNPSTTLSWRPSGETVACPCHWGPFSAPNYPTMKPMGQPGLHAFEVSTASVGLSSDEVYFTGVDFGSFVSQTWK